MCGFPERGPIDFAVRAIAAGAGGQKLAAWALEETVRQQEDRAAQETVQQAMWTALHAERGQ